MSKQLTHLAADNLRSLRGVDLEVPQLLALTGANGTGKTSVLDALDLVKLGYVPAQGKTLAATRELAGPAGEAIHVAGTFNTGFGVRRTFGKEKDTQVLPDEGERNEGEAEKRISEELGAFSLNFDLEAFTSKSGQMRRAEILSILPRELADLDEKSFRLALGYQGAGAGLQAAVSKLWIEHLTAPDVNPIDGLASAIEHTRKKVNEQEQRRKDQAKVLMRAEEVAKAAAAEIVEHDPERLPALQRELGTLNEQLGALKKLAQERDRAAEKRTSLLKQIANLRTSIQAGEERLKELEESIAGLVKPESDEAADAERQRLLDEQRAAVAELESLHAEAQKAARRAQERVSDIQVRLDTVNEQWEAIGDTDTCPHCNEKGGIERLKNLLRISKGELAPKLADAVDASELADKDVTELEGELKEARATVAQCVAEGNAAGSALAEYSRRLGEMQAVHTDLGERLGWERAELERLETRELPESVEVDDERLDRLSWQVDTIGKAIEVEQSILTALGAAQEKQDAVAREQAAFNLAEKRTAILKGLYANLQKLRGEVVARMVGPVEEAAAALLRSVDPSAEFQFSFEREGKAAFDFGFEKDGVWRGFSAASGGESALLATVFVAAVMDVVDPPWRVLMLDSLENVDSERQVALLEAIAEHRDWFDNVIVASCYDIPEVEGWTVMHVRELSPVLTAGAA